MRTAHHLHGVFDMAPLPGIVVLAAAFAHLRLLRGLGDRRSAVLLEHLPRDGVNLGFRHHVVLLTFCWVRAAARVSLTARGAHTNCQWGGLVPAAQATLAFMLALA